MASLLALLCLLCACPTARAQSDTTRPVLALNAPDGGTTFTALPATLTGTIYDAGGGAVRLWVRFARNHNGSSEWWNGTEWSISSSGASYAATVQAPDAGGNYSWSVAVPWPAGADLRRGSYSITVKAYDAAGNRSDISREVIIGAPDNTAPAIEIVNPANFHLIDSSSETLSTIAGTVRDNDGTGEGEGSGVAYVQVSLYRNWYDRFQYWDGNSWEGAGRHIFTATLGAPDAAGQRGWSVTDGLPPREQLGTGQYFITALGFDYNGNRGVAYCTLHAAPRDTIAPTASVSFPAEGQQLVALSAIRGTSADAGSGVSDVRVFLSRTAASGAIEYWDSTAWVTRFSNAGILPDRADTLWTREQNLPAGADLPPGDYQITVSALDRYYNAARVYRGFTIVPTPPLSIDAQIRGASSQGGAA